MKVIHRESANGCDGCEIRIGEPSWPSTAGEYSIKFASPDKRGHMARGGEVPMGALPQMVAMATHLGYLRLEDGVLRVDTGGPR